MTATLNAYELERETRIANNKRKMQVKAYMHRDLSLTVPGTHLTLQSAQRMALWRKKAIPTQGLSENC
jgi:hypothetical protein